MKTRLIAVLICVVVSLCGTPALASLDDCKDIYVGQIRIKEGHMAVYFRATPSGSNSYYVYLRIVSEETRKAMLSVLLTHRAMGVPLGIKTDAADGCSIRNAGSELLEIQTESPYFF